jgi:Mo25-like
MTRYISNPDNLKLMMNMLREKSRNIQFEAFHVFKVFYLQLKLTILNQFSHILFLLLEAIIF